MNLKTGNQTKKEKISTIENEQIEGFATHLNHYFFTNEKRVNELIVLDKDTKTKKAIEFANKNFSFPDPGNNENGIEGIEIDKQNNIIYVILEGKEKPSSLLYRIKIEKISKHTVYLKILSKLEISKDTNYRYCALAFDDTHNLLLLRTDYGKYHIDKIAIEQLNTDTSTKIKPEELIDFSDYVNNKAGYFNTNFEGLAFHEGEIIVISDNGGSRFYRNAQKGTMLIKIKL